MGKQNKTSDLPYEILEEILSRLPVKYLVRFKCVSKSWLSLISDPKFALLQLSRAYRDFNMNVLVPTPTSTRLRSLDCSKTSSFSDEAAFVIFDFPFEPPRFFKIIGSCNGLVCVALNNFESFFIWNPATGAYTKLPHLDIPDIADRQRYEYGFGYNSSTDDYKVFFLCRYMCHTFIDADIAIFGTKTGSWRKIQSNFSIQWHSESCRIYHWHTSSMGSLLNGTLHWLTIWCCPCPWEIRMITAFDLAEERFIEVPIPSILSVGINFKILGVLNGCLCLLGVSHDVSGYEIWMMKEYGVRSSWEKLFTLRDHVEIKSPADLVPLCLTRWDEVIFINNGNQLIRCNTKGETLESVMIACNQNKVHLEAAPHTESFISPQVSV